MHVLTHFRFIAILTLAVVDLIYGVFVSPFFVEVRNSYQYKSLTFG